MSSGYPHRPDIKPPALGRIRLVVLLAPFTMAVFAIPVVIAMAEAGWSIWGIVYGMIAYSTLYILISLAATVTLVRDARGLGQLDAEWQPTAWKYLLGGAAVFGLVTVPLLGSELLAVATLPLLGGGLGLGLLVVDVIGAVIGWVVAMVFAAPVIAGPAYIWRRRRRLDRR